MLLVWVEEISPATDGTDIGDGCWSRYVFFRSHAAEPARPQAK